MMEMPVSVLKKLRVTWMKYVLQIQRFLLAGSQRNIIIKALPPRFILCLLNRKSGPVEQVFFIQLRLTGLTALPVSGDDVIFNNGTFQPTLSGNVQVNSVFIRGSAVLSLSTNNLSVLSYITNCGTITGGLGGVILNGGATTIQNQNLSGSGTYNLTDLTVNNIFATSPAVILNKDINVSGALALTSGIVYTSATNILALGTSATSGSGSSSSFVSGPISKAGTANFVFPTGKGTKWRRTSLTNITASSTYRAEYFNSAYTNVTSVNSRLWM